MKGFVFLFLVFNLFTFLVFGYDKYLARTNRPRVREKTLLNLALMGGSVGAVFGQKIFRHKTKKSRYRFWIILVVQFALFELMWYYAPVLAQIFRSLWA
ncbi:MULTISPECIES: DUF1294 domain-containing protein [unclassified Sulfuricurvum]|uniref:DUF1294 domain-containing protein n=1 Tax=unclassified Sulfuricurvum TaxID=2632390 RepID=UPI00029993E7|nr:MULTISPECIES: DUF1294 domain-containing protein [unclassified Sulfuricurvum]AFV97364.1 hypothetical protein B649_05250 [Candidatus Sulfuricurvum sp. RIFRC-1]OHD85066.1 MAG: hypothetical protein A3I60_00675 [Sulfuricurvum sp. RIFCSPLOWO2_02_FULL_43_45]OHD88329.1 MAG: hypothetical protein A3G19_11185 [Sulfuricurvum sp. RIFCSPLOWO2_12_FULL_43_24]HBM35013.1 DUF1294 domain-containing protein [Sulfuricurvum sp.]